MLCDSGLLQPETGDHSRPLLTQASTGDTQTLKIEDYILESQAEIFSWDDNI